MFVSRGASALQGWAAYGSDGVFVYRDDGETDDWSKDDEAIVWLGATRIYEVAIAAAGSTAAGLTAVDAR